MIGGVSSLTATDLLARARARVEQPALEAATAAAPSAPARTGAAVPAPATAAAPQSPAHILAPLAWVPSAPRASTPTSFATTIKHTAQDGALIGKKLGMLAAASVISSVLPLQLIMALPYSAPIALIAPVALVGSLIVGALEEQYVGIGKHVGGLVGGALGAVVGTAKATYEKASPPDEKPEKIQLDKQAPTGKAPHEPLLPRLLHAAETKLTGQAPKTAGQAVGVGEAVGATLGTLVVAYTLPAAVGAMIGGPIGLAMSTLAGPLTGMIVGGALENALGIGRAAGEVTGRVVQRFQGEKAATPQPAQGKTESGIAMKAFLELNHIIAQPIMPYLIDGTLLMNKMFAEKPVQSMAFEDRPSPSVDRTRLTENFIKLRNISGTPEKEADVSAEIGRQLDAMGISYMRKADQTIIATIPGTVKDAPTVVLSAHMDTVGPTSPGGVRRDERKIFTNGREILGGDDRAGCAEILEGVKRILETGADHPELKLVFDVGEEAGLKGASRLTPDEISLRPALGFVMDALAPEDINLTNDAVFINPSSIKYSYSQEDAVVQVAMKAMADAGLKARPLHVPIMAGAGSDANTVGFNNPRIRTIALGAGETDIHSPLENVKIDDLEQAARHVVGVIQNSCDLRVDGDRIVPRQALQLA